VPDLGITAPDKGYVGEDVEVMVTEGTGLCRNCNVKWVSGSGKAGSGKTNGNGILPIHLEEEGAYKVTVSRDPRKFVRINAVSRPGVLEDLLSAIILGEAAKPCTLWLAVLLALIVGLVLYLRRRRGMPKMEKEQPKA
jgi:hypothetical protein